MKFLIILTLTICSCFITISSNTLKSKKVSISLEEYNRIIKENQELKREIESIVNNLEYKQQSSFLEMTMKSDPVTKAMTFGFPSPRASTTSGDPLG